MGRVVLLVIAVAGCGRVGFDPLGGDGGDGGDDDSEPNLVFVSSSRHQIGSLGGVAAGDAICAARAEAASLVGTYRALLSEGSEPATRRIESARGWVRLDGKPVLDRPEELVEKMFYPVLFDDANFAGQHVVATGLDGTGAATATCADYTSTTGPVGCGYADSTVAGFTEFFAQCACSGTYHLYCFGIDRRMPVTPVPVSGRRMFLHPGWQSGNGIASADDACADAAAAASFPGTFLAFLATISATAASRFDPNGPPWVRPDGIPVATTAAAFLAGGQIDAPPNVTPSGTYVTSLVRTGATAPNVQGMAPTTCSNWGSMTVGDSSEAGSSSTTNNNWWRSLMQPDCSMTLPIYCLEQ